MADDLGERTEEATPKKKQEARDEGRVAKSQDLAAVILLVVTSAAVAATAMWMLGEGKTGMERVLAAEDASSLLHNDSAMEAVVFVAMMTARIAAPLLIVAWIAGLLSHLVQIGWLVSPKALMPKPDKLNPISGFKRVFGLSALVKAGLDALKVLLVVAVAVWTIRQRGEQMLTLPYLTTMEGLASVGWLMLDLALRLLAVLLILAILDLIYQKWKHAEDLKMTKQQVKDEMKQTEGDPETKRRRMRMQQQIAAQRISAAVPKADVVVTNPEHISIALQYDEETMRAPKVLAKGADHLALRIRRIAAQHGIPIVERKPLARAMYRSVEAGQEIPPDFYKAVAEVLAYVYQLEAGSRPGASMAG
jgi:flagellar biosynthetic protein FlhB